MGITGIELGDGEPPLVGFVNVHPMRSFLQILRNPPPTLTRMGQWSKEFNDFLSECLIKDYVQRPYSVELAQHPFLSQVSNCSDIIRRQLVTEIELMKTYSGRIKRREPEVMIKHGKLKFDRKAGLQTMWTDDLAFLPTIDEVFTLWDIFKVDKY